MAETRLPFLLLGSMLSLSLANNPVCDENMNEGSGDEQTLLYFYDKAMDICRPFYYKGMEGNGNRFNSDGECMRLCSPRSHELYPATDEVCKLPVDHGSCFAMLLMYYYNAEEDNCRIFHYGGCQGNGNRFNTREECLNTCMARAGRSGSAGSKANPDLAQTSVGLVVGILGGVIFAVALTISALFFVKDRKQKAKKKGREQDPAVEMNCYNESDGGGARS